MNIEPIEHRIEALLEQAAPLRALDDDDPRVEPLTGIVDEINRLRAQQDIDRRNAVGVEPDAPTTRYLPRGDDLTNACVEGSKALPPRRELERAANAAGVSFSARIGDVKLAERLRAAGVEV